MVRLVSAKSVAVGKGKALHRAEQIIAQLKQQSSAALGVDEKIAADQQIPRAQPSHAVALQKDKPIFFQRERGDAPQSPGAKAPVLVLRAGRKNSQLLVPDKHTVGKNAAVRGSVRRTVMQKRLAQGPLKMRAVQTVDKLRVHPAALIDRLHAGGHGCRAGRVEIEPQQADGIP